MILLKKDKDIEGLRKSGRILVNILLTLKEMAKEGVSLMDLENKAREMLKEAGASSAFLNYKPEGAQKPYPAALCTSLNDQIVHGQPSDRKLDNGDILKIDFGVVFENWITDAALTLGIGEISEEAKLLIKTTEEALNEALTAAKTPKARLGDIGWIIENTAEKNGLSVVEGLTGHGVGFKLHEDPIVYNYGNKGEGMLLKKGLVIAIEPMLSAGSSQFRQAKDDSFYTKDGSLSAHFEKTIAVTDNGIEILTAF
ncbi:type I methionyl aminopeptidase [Patescibacteria group bacterium]|nr:type I methionyl aminopeptidase [Patescibacteria group bacterium]